MKRTTRNRTTRRTANQSRASRRRAARTDVVGAAAKAAAAGNRRSDSETQSHRKFLTLVAGIFVAGTLLVGFAWAGRQYDHPTVLDSWQSAYGVFDCTTETWLEPFDDRSNPEGIRSRGDGMIYIEPATESVTGDNANLGVFLDAVGVTLTDDTLQLPGGTRLGESGTFCANEEATLQVLRWDYPGAAEFDTTSPVEVRYEDLTSTVFKADRETFAIALAPAGATIPLPPSANDLPTTTTISAAPADATD